MSSLPISDSNAYAIIEKNGVITLYQGLLHHFNSLDEVEALQKKTQKTVVFLVPHCSIRERGYEAKGKEPIIVLEAKDQTIFTKEEISKLLPTKKIKLQGDIIPSISDNEFSHLVEKVQKKEIQRGNATQVVISRRFEGKLDTKCEENALSIFRQLLDQKGQYMTIVFVEKQKGFYLVGATPERHLEITNDSTIMMPIAGTLPKGDLVTFPKRLRSFLQDKKEINELFQVLDEECKMMARICPYGGVIRGPLLRETGAVIHTEYGLFGYRTNLSLIQAFRETLHAPTLVGGPLESSARIIAHYEKDSRRYYGGEICVLRPDQTFDSAILIRCAEIDKEGNISVQAGAGIVRDSVPKKETAETRAKAEGLLSLLQQKISVSDFYLTSDREQEISPLLRERNEFLSRFLCDDQSDLTITNKLSNTQITIINNEDNFSHVLGHMLGHMKYGYKIVDTFEFDVKKDTSDIVIIGPGPGDINDDTNPRMSRVKEITKMLLKKHIPVLGICLGHQALALELGFPVTKQSKCTQGVQREETVFGKIEKLGFYNSFSPEFRKNISSNIKFDIDKNNCLLTLSGDHFIGVQFHPESIMTQNGYEILARCLFNLKKYPQFSSRSFHS